MLRLPAALFLNPFYNIIIDVTVDFTYIVDVSKPHLFCQVQVRIPLD